MQLDHRDGLLQIALRQVGDAEKDMLGRKPGHVELAPDQRAPTASDEFGREPLSGKTRLLAAQDKAAVAGVELPQLPRVRPHLQNVARMDDGLGRGLLSRLGACRRRSGGPNCRTG